jgi:hypothetical protein
MTAGSPLRHPTIQCSAGSQNVAGLWLKYGTKSPKNTVYWRRKKTPRYDDLLTITVDNPDWAGL